MSAAAKDNVFNDQSQANYKYRTDKVKASSIYKYWSLLFSEL